MGKTEREPGRSGMTGITVQIGDEVPAGCARRRGTVVTTITTSVNRRMIKIHW